MRNTIALCVALAGALTAAPVADAFKTSLVYRVSIDGSSAGNWVPRGLVQDIGYACRYSIRWRGNCFIDEFKAGPSVDCDEARRRFYNTGVDKPDDQPCIGEDESGQRTRVVLLSGGESSSGRIRGVIQVASVGDVQILYVRPRS